MPAVSGKEPGDFRVLITGFGPFGSFKQENPSWTAVKTLHNLVLETNTTSVNPPKRIHITSVFVETAYKEVLKVIPGFHSRPPVLPSHVKDAPTPPPNGYDFVLHVGVAPPDLCRLESRGHKYGYDKPDNDGELAPIVDKPSSTFDPNAPESEEEKGERKRLEEYYRWVKGDKVRGFGKGYEEFDDTIISDLNASDLVEALNSGGYKDVRLSDNAGRYLCDFIYYCSLSEKQRTDNKNLAHSNPTRVLFLHCPPINEPLSTEQVVDCIKRLVILVSDKIADKGN